MTAASFRTVVGDGDAALDKRLSDELDVVNAAATVGTPAARELTVQIDDASGDLAAGVSGWTWGVAAGIGHIALGSDIGGSVRYPAYACGIHGLRPGLGRVPAFNASSPERAIGPQLMSGTGPMARTIADLRLALAAMSMPDARDPWYAPVPLAGPPRPKRVARA